MFKLKAQNVLFWAAAPTLLARYSYSQAMHDRVDNLWRIHQNRAKQGLGGTYSPTGYHENMHQDSNFQINNGMHLRYDTLMHGIRSRPYLNNPFTRFHETVEDYADFHDDIDDHSLYETDNWERLKPFTAKPKDVVGTTTQIPMDDNDELLHFYDIQGESLYTNPPDPNLLTVDHGLEEDHVWAFRLSAYNQNVVTNQYSRNLYKATQQSNVPFWGKKLAAPSFYRDEKFRKWSEHWGYRLGLELIKMKHAVELNPSDPKQRRAMKAEIQQYLAQVQDKQAQREMENVYTTDHKHRAAKLNTLSADEDEHFFAYMQSLQQY